MKRMKFLHMLLFIEIWIILPVEAQTIVLPLPNITFGGYSIFNPTPSPAHATSKDFIPASPAAASLGIYGQIPVGNYTGTAEISVPLYEISYKELSVPISISYHASGIKPDIFPGPVGLGWTLNAGGAITRVVHGSPDFGTGPPAGEGLMYWVDDDVRRFDDWSDSTRLAGYLKSSFNLPALKRVIDPDEFYFNFNGHTGKFYMNPPNIDWNASELVIDTFEIQSAQGDTYRILMEIGTLTGSFAGLPQTRTDMSKWMSPPRNYSNNITLSTQIKKITLIDSHGIKYVFGGSFNAIEYSRPGFLERQTSVSTQQNIQPMSWFLISIESPNGYNINFSYGQQTIVSKTRFTEFNIYSIYNHAQAGSTPLLNTDRNILINSCYLREILFPSGKATFSNSQACNQLDYPYGLKYEYEFEVSNLGMQYIWFMDYADVYAANTEKVPEVDSNPATIRDRFFPYKLDTIQVFDRQGNRLHKTYFDYTTERTTRLKLKKLKVNEKAEYTFNYNQQSLPAYLSGMTDHYGFYNGKQLFKGISNQMLHVYNHPEYIDSMRSPDSNYAQAEILKSIYYPTKGYTLFEYEPHEYGCTYHTWPFATQNNTQGNLQSGGVRIKRILNYDVDGTLLNEKKYHYVKDFKEGGNQSSGVLAYQPKYIEQYGRGTMKRLTSSYTLDWLFFFSSNPIYPMTSTRGNHVTYSEVAVENIGNDGNNGFSVYKYKNYDNGYLDKELITTVSNDYLDINNKPVEFWKTDEGISLALERGQLLSEEIYDKDGNPKKKEEYFYNDDSTRFDENVRYLNLTANSVNFAQQLLSYRITAGVHYTYFPYLKEKRTTEYFNLPLVTTQHYTYHPRYRLLKKTKTTDSQNRTITQQTQYAFESQSVYLPAHKTMLDSFMLNYPVETTILINDSLGTGHGYFYAKGLSVDNTSLISLLGKINAIEHHSRIEAIFTKYDKVGNPLDIEYESGRKICLLWSYNRQYMVAQIEGLGYDAVKTAFGNNNMNNLLESESPEQIKSLLNLLRSSLSNTTAMVTTCTYRPLIGLSSKTDPSGKTIFYGYDERGRLTESYVIENGIKKILQSNYYQFSNE
ncbi:hypothetical protein EZS27_017608 [termite gut metagenome]|uniref:YD repeat-containing protein n=1 Tax=termite gut metagenome TaxID=433724 RepID=A0A5J4RL40_9ZZZZ